MHLAQMIEIEVGTADVVAALQAEAREVGAAMRRIVDACGEGDQPRDADLEKADAWLRAVGA